MTDWWQLIDDYCHAKDWFAVLVCADGLQENEEEQLADTLRWMLKNNIFPKITLLQPGVRGWTVDFPVINAVPWACIIYIREHTIQKVVCRIDSYRRGAIKFYQ